MTAPNLPESPYKGLVPFDDSELDARLFFGRERETELVAANLMASRLTVLYGPSGVGKSSLLRAGVVRRLRALVGAGAAEGDAAAVIVDRWRDDPVGSVAGAVGARPPDPGEGLADVLPERLAEIGGELYLILDQMEEYFLYHGRERGGPLAEQLADTLARPDLRVHVLLGIRDDSLSELDAFKARLPGLFGNVLGLDHLDRTAARQAIVGPLEEYARLGGPEVVAQPALVDAVLDQVATGRIEQGLAGRGSVDEETDPSRIEAPYLQLVLERLWELERSRGSDVLRAETLAELGGADRIVEQHLERALAPLEPGGREIAARLFNHLVTPSGTKIAHSVDDLARYAGTDDEHLRPVLNDLVVSRIVRPMPARNGAGPRYEIFHDVLADAVIAWRTQHETDAALTAERAESRRRHRRLATVAGVALVGLALMATVAAYALVLRERADDRARTAKARELTVASLGQLREDPELSLVLALEAARREPTPAVESALRTSLVNARARQVVERGTPLLAAALDGEKVITADGSRGTSAAAFSPDGDRLARAVGRKMVVSRADGTRLATVEMPARVVRVALARNAGAAAAADGTTTVVALPGGEERFRTKLPSRPTALGLSADGHYLAAASGKITRVYHLGHGRQPEVFESRSTVLGADVSPDHTRLATAHADGGVRLWDLAKARLSDVMRGHTNSVRAVSFSPDGKRLATGSADTTARIWRVEDGHEFAVLAGNRDEVLGVKFSPNGRLVTTASKDGSARVWDAVGDPQLRRVASFRQTPFLQRVTGTDAVVRVGKERLDVDLGSGDVVSRSPVSAEPSVSHGWRIDIDGKIARLRRAGRTIVLRGHDNDITSVRLSPDGKRAVTASEDHDVRTWSMVDGSNLHVIKAAQGPVADARFSPDGRWIVTAGPGAGGVFAADSGELLFYLRGHEGPLTGAAFAPDGTTIVTSGSDGTVRAYRCAVCGGTEDLVALAERHLTETRRRLTPAERRRYVGS